MKTKISTRVISDKDILFDYEMNMNSISDQAVTREDHRSANWRVVKQQPLLTHRMKTRLPHLLTLVTGPEVFCESNSD